MTQPPARVGDPLDSVETPALLLDLDAVEHNLALVHGLAARHGVRVRPHAKAHKCPELARLQRRAGAHGLCCQKMAEAEVFAEAGFDDLLVTNQIVGAGKAARAAALAERVRLAVCVDHPAQVDGLATAMQGRAHALGVYVEVDIGQGRCGVASEDEVIDLAARIAGHAPRLRFDGLHAFNGAAQHRRARAEREQSVREATAWLAALRQRLAGEGLPCATLTGGGTGTLPWDVRSGVYDEVQPGSYVLMDADYADNEPPLQADRLHAALHGRCSVISLKGRRAVLDGGLKTFATDRGLPRVLAPGWTVSGLSDEHTVIVKEADDAVALHLGDKLRLLPGHCDPTVNLHDWLVAMRADRVEAVWPVAARGALL